MPRVAIPTSRSLGQFLRRSRGQLQLTLEEVSRRAAAAGEPIPVPTLVRIESGVTDPGIRRLAQLLRIYELDPQTVFDVVENEAGVNPAAGTRGLEESYAEAVRRCKAGDLRGGLPYLGVIRERALGCPDGAALFQKATLSFAIAARDLGRLHLAKHLVEELLTAPPLPNLQASVLLVAATVWDGLGSTTVAHALLREADRHAAPDQQQRAWILHQLAKVLWKSGERAEALIAIEQARSEYRALNDTHDLPRADLLRINILQSLDRTEEAVALCRELRQQALDVLTAALVHVYEGRLLLRMDRTDVALVVLREGLGRAVALGNESVEFLAHYYLWRAWERSGDSERARFERDAACYFVRFVDEPGPEVNDIRAVLARDKRGDHAHHQHPRRRTRST